jgi:hypothetical protein
MTKNMRHFLSALETKLLDTNSADVPHVRCRSRLGFVVTRGTWIGCVVASLLCAAIPVTAQIRSGTITGLVTDPKGAVIVGAEVTVTNSATHVSTSTTTTDTGLYTVPYLSTGTYSVSISKPGFATTTINGISLTPSQIARADAPLQVGATSAVVQVQATTEQLQTESSTISQSISPVVVNSIPNVTQNPLYFLTLLNNVQARQETYASQTVNSAGVGVAGRAELSAIGVNGGRAFENDIQLDGLPITGDGFNEMTIVPNEQGIEQEQVISNNFTAEYGHGQSVMEITTKSGTNDFHGEADWLIRNEALNANSWGNKFENIKRPPFKRNYFGGALGAPILKDKLFFFSSFLYMMQNIGLTRLATVPTDLERTGDFTHTFQQGANGQPVAAQLYNPYQITQIAPNEYQRAPITPAVITPSLLPDPSANASAQLMYSFYPHPNRSPDDVYNTNNFQSSVVETIRQKSSNNRVDFKHGKQSFYGSGGIYWDDVVSPFIFNVAPASKSFNNAPSTTSDRNGYAQVGDTVVLSPTLVLDVRYGITRTHAINFGGLPSGFNQYNAFGIPSATQALFAKPGAAPVIYPSGFGFSGGSGGGSNWAGLAGGGFANKEERQIGHALVGSVTKVHGNWTYKAGAEYRVILANYTDFEEGSTAMNFCCAGDPGGNYSFEFVNAAGGKTPDDNSPLVDGINSAALLLGQGVWFVRPGANLKPAYAAKYFAIYTQNDWRVRPGLTLNLGLRWDLQPGPSERYNRMAGVDFTKINPFGVRGELAFPGTNGYSHNLWDTEYHDFQPRLGVAWQFRPTWVIRGGFGISYLPSNTGYFSSPNDYGEASFAPGNEALPYGSNPSGMPVTEFTDAAPLVPAVGPNINAPQNYGVSEAYFNRHLHNQVVRQANFFIEKSFGGSGQWLASVGWSDAISRHLTTRNQPFEDIQLVASAILSNWKAQYIANNGTSDPSTQQVPNPYQPASGPLLPFQNQLANRTISQLIPNLPYPLLYGSMLNGDAGFADYNALLARVSHHFASGFDLTFNYTWSKELDYVTTGIEDGQGVDAGGGPGTPDLINPENNKNYGTADMPNMFNAIAVYQSPFGAKGGHALTSRVGRGLAGGWMLSTVVSIQGGYPVYMSMGGDGAMTSRIDRNPAYPLEVPKDLQHWYNGSTTVTLPCGTTITPPKYTFLKYDLCAFQGETLTAPNGKIIPNIYWIGDSPQTNGNIRLPGRTNVDGGIGRTIPIGERVNLQIRADVSNLFNHPEFNASPGGGMGNVNLKNNPASGLVPGIGSSSGFGSRGPGTYDPRQLVFHAFVRF